MYCHNGIAAVLNPVVRLATSLALYYDTASGCDETSYVDDAGLTRRFKPTR